MFVFLLYNIYDLYNLWSNGVVSAMMRELVLQSDTFTLKKGHGEYLKDALCKIVQYNKGLYKTNFLHLFMSQGPHPLQADRIQALINQIEYEAALRE